MNALRAAAIAALLVSNAGLAHVARADDITLRSNDGAMEVSGALLGFDGDFFRVDTEYGVLTVDGARVACEGAACPGPDPHLARFTIAGAGVMTETLFPALIGAFAARFGYDVTETRDATADRVFELRGASEATPGADIVLRDSTATEALVDLVSDQADMALALRDVTPFESAIATDAGLGDFSGPYAVRVLARDALVARVHDTNKLRELTVEDLVGVFSGAIDTWSAIGGPEEPITRHLTDPQSGLGEVFVRRVLEANGAALSPDTVIHPSTEALAEALDQDPSAIGITAFSDAESGRMLHLAGSCGFDVVAEVQTIEAGDYPLTLPLYLFLPERRLPQAARDFLAFLGSPAAQDVVGREGFVAQDFTLTPLEHQGGRLANAISAAGPEISLGDLQRMIPLFSGKRRLSLSFRFLDGTTTLDPASVANVAMLATALKQGDFEGRDLSFAGFSDGTGSADGNLRLSERRAEAVRAAVMARAGRADTDETFDAEGFGEALPMACDDTPWGRQVNRRVEVWVGPVAGSE